MLKIVSVMIFSWHCKIQPWFFLADLSSERANHYNPNEQYLTEVRLSRLNNYLKYSMWKRTGKNLVLVIYDKKK